VKFFERVLHLTAIFIAMMAIKPVLGLIVYASLVFFYISVKSIEKHVIKIETAEEKKIDDANDIIYESLDNIKDIKLLNGINYEKEKFGEWTNQYAKNKLNSDLIDEDSRMNLQNFFVGIIFSIVLGLASWLSSDASFGITAGTITVYVIFVPIVFVTFKSLMNNHITIICCKANNSSLPKDGVS
jgi:ABC-type multidrug transport system fused ATPase/permease subunit